MFAEGSSIITASSIAAARFAGKPGVCFLYYFCKVAKQVWRLRLSIRQAELPSGPARRDGLRWRRAWFRPRRHTRSTPSPSLVRLCMPCGGLTHAPRLPVHLLHIHQILSWATVYQSPGLWSAQAPAWPMTPCEERYVARRNPIDRGLRWANVSARSFCRPWIH